MMAAVTSGMGRAVQGWLWKRVTLAGVWASPTSIMTVTRISSRLREASIRSYKTPTKLRALFFVVLGKGVSRNWWAWAGREWTRRIPAEAAPLAISITMATWIS